MNKPKDKYTESKGFLGFRAAWNGIVILFCTQVNARIHAVIAALVLVMGVMLKISTNEWLVVILCMAMVFATEMMNTAIESLTDIASPGYNKKAGIVKDLAAGAVLISAISAAIVGTWIFLPKLLEVIGIWSVTG